MNNNENNYTAKAFCYLILLVSAGISAFLTITFMHSLGQAIGMALVFALVGLTLDLTKTFAPALAAKVITKSVPTALALGAISLGLVALSGAASVFSLQNGVQAALQSTKTAQIAQQKVDAVQAEIAALQTLQQQQLAANFITVANKTQSQIAEKNSELTALLDQTVSADDGSLLSKFSDQIVIIIAVAIELVSVIMTLCLHHLNQPKTVGGTAQDNAGQRRTDTPETRMDKGFAPKTQDKTEQAQSSQNANVLVFPTNMSQQTFLAKTTKEQTLEELKCLLLTRTIKPRHRSIFQAFKGNIRKSEINDYLTELGKKGVLMQVGKSWELAA